MPYKLIKGLILPYILLSASVYATSDTSEYWPYTHDTLKTQLDKTYKALNDKTGFCMNLQKERKLEEIDNNWLITLPKNELNAVLLVLNTISYKRCTQQETTDYTLALINYTTETKDMSHLNEWLILNETYHSKDVRKYIKHIPSDKIIEASKTESFYYPFSVHDAYDIITNSSNEL